MNADKKISELPQATSLTLDDMLAVVHNGETSRVALRDLIKELQLTIPQPRIKIRRDARKEYYGHDMVHAFWEGSDNRFLKYNPQFWLYRYKKAELRTYFDSLTSTRKSDWRAKRFVHPSHQHGDGYYRTVGQEVKGWRQFDGEQKIMWNDRHDRIAARNTEWKVADHPLEESHLDLSPWTYYRIPEMDLFEGILPDAFPLKVQPKPRGTGSSNSRLVIFKVRIAIDNPDTESDQPKLFGPFSETFILHPFKSSGEFKYMKYFLGSEAAPQLR